MKKTWNVNVNGTTHTIEYKAGVGVKVVVNGQEYRTKSQNWWINMIDYPIQIDDAQLRVVAVGNKVDLAVNGIYQGSGETYEPLHKVPALSNVFLGLSCVAGFLLCKWVGLLIGIAFGSIYIKQGLKGKTGAVIGAFIGCTAIQVVIMLLVSALLLSSGYYY